MICVSPQDMVATSRLACSHQREEDYLENAHYTGSTHNLYPIVKATQKQLLATSESSFGQIGCVCRTLTKYLNTQPSTILCRQGPSPHTLKAGVQLLYKPRPFSSSAPNSNQFFTYLQAHPFGPQHPNLGTHLSWTRLSPWLSTSTAS